MAKRTAVATIQALSSLADDDKIDLPRILEGRGGGGVQLCGAEVDKVVQLKAQLQQQAALQDSGGHFAGCADGTEQDGIVLAQACQILVGEEIPRSQVAPRAEVKIGHRDIVPDGTQHLECLSGYLGPDAVSTNNCQSHNMNSISHYVTS